MTPATDEGMNAGLHQWQSHLDKAILDAAFAAEKYFANRACPDLLA
jgi:hypothetical protein